MVPPRGCAYVVMAERQEASKVLVTLKNERLHGNSLKVCIGLIISLHIGVWFIQGASVGRSSESAF